MGFDGFSSLPTAAQAGIIAFGLSLTLLAIVQLVMAASLRTGFHSAALNALRRDVKTLTKAAEDGAARQSSNGLAPPPRPVRARKRRRAPK